MPAVNYSARDIIYRPRNVRAHKVYGYSPVQQVLMTVNIAGVRRICSSYSSAGSSLGTSNPKAALKLISL